MFGRVFFVAPTLVLLLSGAAGAQAPTITLREAIIRALASHPDLRAAGADVAVSRGELLTARTNPFNPSLTWSVEPSVPAGASSANYQIGIAQTVELGGKRAARRGAAELRLQAAVERRARQRTIVAWSVQHAFNLALVARQRVMVAIEADSVGLSLRTAAQDRLTLGKATQLEFNVAAAAAARDHRVRLKAESDLVSALITFRAALGVAPDDPVIPLDSVPRFNASSTTPESLIAIAFRQRTDLAALRAERGAAEADARLASRLWWPDPELGISTGREEDLRRTLVGVSVPFPLWNRGQGQRATAAGAADRARVAEDSAVRAVQREVIDAHQALGSALASLDAFGTEIIERLSENLSLARESFEAGKISLYTYNTIRRDLVEARLAYLEALTDAVDRRYALALAVGEAWE